MRLVDRPWKTPGRCALVAHIDPFSTPTARWVDTDGVLLGHDQHVYVSDVGVRQAMSILGFPLPVEFEAMEARAIEAEDLAIALADKLEEAQAQLEAIDVLESAAYTARRKPNRKVAA